MAALVLSCCFPFAVAVIDVFRAARASNFTPRHECGVVALGGKVFLLGGFDVKPVEEYDPVTDTWRQLSAPPMELHHFQAVAARGKIFVAGALTGEFPREPAVPSLYVFDPVSDRWTLGPSVPFARRRGSAGVVVFRDRWLFLVCGTTNGHWNGFVGWLDRLDLRTGEWTTLADAPHARDHLQAAIIDQRIVTAGGRTSHAERDLVFELTVPHVDVFDIESGEWQTLAELIPTERAGASVAAVGSFLFVVGGESKQHEAAHSDIEVLSVSNVSANGAWRRMRPLAVGRHGTGLALVGETLFMPGGCSKRGKFPWSKSMEMLHVWIDDQTSDE